MRTKQPHFNSFRYLDPNVPDSVVLADYNPLQIKVPTKAGVTFWLRCRDDGLTAAQCDAKVYAAKNEGRYWRFDRPSIVAAFERNLQEAAR